MTTETTDRSVDPSLIHGGTWERATFTVPVGTPEEKVHFYGDRYMRRFGDHLEAQDFKVKAMSTPEEYRGKIPVDEDRKRYVIWAYISRRPVVHTIDIPDMSVPAMQRLGMNLVD